MDQFEESLIYNKIQETSTALTVVEIYIYIVYQDKQSKIVHTLFWWPVIYHQLP